MWREGFMLALGFAIAGSGIGRRRNDAPRIAGDRDAVARARRDEGAEDLRDRFLGTISHELRTPLNAIIGWAQMLRSGRLSTPDVDHAIAAIDRNARLEVQLIEDLLDVSHMQRGRLRIRREPVDLVAVVTEATNSLRHVAATAGVDVHVETPDRALGVLGDWSRLQQIVRHAVGNAIKFTPRGGHVRVQLAGAGAYAELRVSDDGIGVARQYIRRVFEPFFQAPSAVRRTGLGLGLTLIQDLVEAHHGTVALSSRGFGQGSVLILRLPLTRARQWPSQGTGGYPPTPAAASFG